VFAAGCEVGSKVAMLPDAEFRCHLLLDHTNRTTLPVCASHGGNIAAALACVLGKQSLIDRGSIKP
jgi:hypothetical protein